ncbi:MAG: hypothetical protein AAF990_11190 [Bacteroidota bacterium]
MFKYLNRVLFENEKHDYIKDSVEYNSYSDLIEDKRIVAQRKGSNLRGKFFASTSEDPILARLLDDSSEK